MHFICKSYFSSHSLFRPSNTYFHNWLNQFSTTQVSEYFIIIYGYMYFISDVFCVLWAAFVKCYIKKYSNFV